MSNSYFGFTGGNQYGSGTGYGATASPPTGYGNPNQQYGHGQQMPPQRQYTGYDQQYPPQQQQQPPQYSQQNQRYEQSKPPSSNYYSSPGYGHQSDQQSHYPQSMNKNYGQPPASNYSALRTVTPSASNPAPTPTPKSYSLYSSQPSPYNSSYQSPSSHPNNKPVANASSSWTAAALFSANMSSPSVRDGGGGGNSCGITRKPGLGAKPRPKLPPKPQQLHYCEVCKISCAGPQTYKEHLEGQKHKKKEAASKINNTNVVNNSNASATQADATSGATNAASTAASTSNSTASNQKAGSRPSAHGTSLRCELCDVTCTGADAYAAHIRGAKHQKVVKLHTKLGKPIPSTDPVILSSSRATRKDGEEGAEEKKLTLQDIVDQDVQPVGQEYIEEIRNAEGKVISFQCKLCECKFSDPNAKEMHMKGRRHRLQYKKKVNPELVVDIKPSMRRGLPGRHFRDREDADGCWNNNGPHDMFMNPYMRPRIPPPPPRSLMMLMGPPFRRPDTPDDRHILAKHSKIYPPDEELSKIQSLVAVTEKALKGVSDKLAGYSEPDATEKTNSTSPTVVSGTNSASDSTSPNTDETEGKKDSNDRDTNENGDLPPRQLRGVMRVGFLAKGLLLTGDTEVGLVVLSGDKPTKSLLLKVAQLLPEQLEAAVAGEKIQDMKFAVVPDVEEAAIFVHADNYTPRLSVKVTLTSPVMRDKEDRESAKETNDTNSTGQSNTDPNKDPAEVLSKEKCLAALADLRHAKWFQACASSLQSCVMLVRIFRDLRRRVPALAVMDMWPLELLIEKVIASADMPLQPGDALRRVLEAISYGILLPGGSPGLHDPCEKAPTDALAGLNAQDREDITSSAQYALRLIAFRQIHKVLGMDPLPPPKFKPNFNRKRRLDNSSESGEADGKKDKKEDASKKEADASKPVQGASVESTTKN